VLRLSRLLTAVALAFAGGCAGAAAGPAWPKSAGSMVPETWEEDGGESLAPHAVVAESDDEELEDEEELAVEEEVEAVAPAAKPAEEKPAEDKPAEEPTEPILIEEEIIIEVE
jgi:hypothetical protein